VKVAEGAYETIYWINGVYAVVSGGRVIDLDVAGSLHEAIVRYSDKLARRVAVIANILGIDDALFIWQEAYEVKEDAEGQ